MHRIIIALPSTARKLAGKFDTGMQWCYIGKDVRVREQIAEVLGEGKRFYLRDRLQKTAEELRQPFLDFVAEMGKHQKDMLNWWASRFASRNPFQTDFFLLLCYKALIGKIIQEFEKNKSSICIIVDDPWLFSDLREDYKGNANIEFMGQPSLVARKFYFLVRGIVYKALFAGWLFVARVLMFYYHGGRRPAVVKRDKNIVAILSYAEESAFVNGSYSDPYTCGLADLLEANGIGVLRPIYPRFPLSLSREMGELRDVIWPLIFDLRSEDVILSLVKWWSPSIPSDEGDALKVSGHSTLMLLDREWWEEFSTHSFNYNLMFHKAILRFLRGRWCNSLVYIYENQPWEKLLCMAAREANNTRVIGYQHSSMPRFLLSQFLGKGEGDIMPLPDKLLTTGRQLLEMYEEGGIPSDKLSIGGAWRYGYLLRKEDSPTETKGAPGSQGHTVLIALPVDPKYARALLSFVLNGLEDCKKRDISLLIKPHPDMPLSVIGLGDGQLKGLDTVNGPVDELLRKANVILYNSSGVGLEALLYGKQTVVRYVPENLIDMDRTDWIPGDLVSTVYDGDTLERSLFPEGRLRSSREELDCLCQRYFSEVEPQVWLRELKYNLQTVVGKEN